MRKAVQITGAALIAAVLMTGCSSQSDGDKKTGGATPPAAQPDKPADPAAAKGGNVKAADLKGGWSKGKLMDKSLLIMSFSGNMVMLSGKTACSGTVVDTTQPVTINITHCQDGSTEYAKGTIKSVDAKTLTVAWASGKEDTLTKTVGADGKPAAEVPGLPGKLGH
ncbi:hypothetical protein [Streptomyces olivoreticuli]|uniref:hypothetical protein n=1 Tax=Streptomyces olivoreticuli TaxID=68246 RepID=UPI000E230FBC|nr:hypothetical protein [Streptomyces olivoreticuli]